VYQRLVVADSSFARSLMLMIKQKKTPICSFRSSEQNMVFAPFRVAKENEKCMTE
jgi:hypothetical protein